MIHPIDVDALEITDIATSGFRQVQPVDAQIVAPQELECSPTPCPGIIVKIPPGKSVHSAYPFGLHDELGDPWDYTVVTGQLTLYVRRTQGLERIDARTAMDFPAIQHYKASWIGSNVVFMKIRDLLTMEWEDLSKLSG